MASVVRSTALRAGGACVRCRKGKTKCVYENGRAPCKNCAKGMHECYLPSESMSHGGHGVSPARVQQRARESLPSERTVSSASGDRQGPPASGVSRHVSSTAEKYVSSFYSIFQVLYHISVFFFLISPPVYSNYRTLPPLFFLTSFFLSFWGSLLLLPLWRGCLDPPSVHFLALPLGGPGKPQFFSDTAFISPTVHPYFPLLRAHLPVPIPSFLDIGPFCKRSSRK